MKISKKYRNYSKQSIVKNIQTAKMKHIRSMYIVEIILSHLKENKKFSIIKYNLIIKKIYMSFRLMNVIHSFFI